MVRFGDFTLDATTREVTRGGERLHMTPKAFDLLVVLASEAPRVVAKAELHQRLWPDTFVSDATLAGLVKEVRRVLGDRDSGRPVIRTVHRVGYGFAATLEASSPSARGTSHWLVLNGKRVALREGRNVIGRDPNCDVCLDSASSSRRHACIAVEGSVATIEDLGSKNGTSAREVPVAAPIALQDGDRLTFGTTVAVYRSSAAGMSTQTQSSILPRTNPPGR